MNKLNIVEDGIYWDGDQIGFIDEDEAVALLAISDEDLRKWHPEYKQSEIKAHIPQIKETLEDQGFMVVS